MDQTLLAEEFISGGIGIASRSKTKNHSLSGMLSKRFKSILGINSNSQAEKNLVETREEKELKLMEWFYTNYNWENTEQDPIVMPKDEEENKDI